MTANPVPLRLALKRYPQTRALLDSEVRSPLLTFEVHEVEPIHDAFRPMVQRQIYDVSEMAVFTFLQARTAGKPIIALPAILASRFQHPCIIYNSDFNATLAPKDLPGRKVGVRAWSQTTGAWVRHILADEHGVDLASIKWTTFEGGHLDEFIEPPFVRRAPAGTKLLPMLQKGEIDAAILGNDLPDDPRMRAVIPDAKTAGRKRNDETGLLPINHMLCVTQKLADERPDLVREVFRMFRESKAVAPVKPGEPDMRPLGISSLRRSLQQAIDLAVHQQIIPAALSIDDIFADARRILGADAE